MTVPVGTIIGASTKIAEYFGLIEGVNTLITRLLLTSSMRHPN